MRHYKKGRKLGTDASHTKAIKKSIVVALFTNDRIKTTLERAKEVRGDVDRIITLAKRGDVHARRLAIARLGNKELVAEIFSKVEQGLFQGREGGYTRILKLGKRRGDSAVIVILELVQEPISKKAKTTDKAEKTSKAAKSDSAKAATKAQDDTQDEAAVEESASSEDNTIDTEVASQTEIEVESEPELSELQAEAEAEAEVAEVADDGGFVADESTADTSEETEKPAEA